MKATMPAVLPRNAPAIDDLKLAAVWGALAALSVAALMPYLVQLMPARFAQLPIPFGAFVVMQSMQSLVLMGLLAWLGLRMGRRVGLGSPVLHAWIISRARPDWSHLRPGRSALLGGAAGLAIVALSTLLDPLLPAMLNPPAEVGAKASAMNGLASFYGGIAEEVQLRLFLMTFLAWAMTRLRGTVPAAATYWFAAAIAALLFGAGHLPAALHVWGLDASVVARTLLLNGAGGLVFGWLYWKRGLEMAALGHFCADLVVHVVVPLSGLGVAT